MHWSSAIERTDSHTGGSFAGDVTTRTDGDSGGWQLLGVAGTLTVTGAATVLNLMGCRFAWRKYVRSSQGSSRVQAPRRASSTSATLAASAPPELSDDEARTGTLRGNRDTQVPVRGAVRWVELVEMD